MIRTSHRCRLPCVAVAVIVATGCAGDRASVQHAVELQPWRRLEDTRFGLELSPTSEVRLLADSSLLVTLERGPDAVVHVSPQGRNVTSRLRRGGGPRELRRADALIPGTDSGFWVASAEMRRALWLDPRGVLSDSQRALTYAFEEALAIHSVSCGGGLAMLTIDMPSNATHELAFNLSTVDGVNPSRVLRRIGTIRRFASVPPSAYPLVFFTSWRNGRAFEMRRPGAQIAPLRPSCEAGDPLVLQSAWLPSDSSRARAEDTTPGLIEWVDDTTLASLGARKKRGAAPNPFAGSSDGRERPFDRTAYVRYMEANYEVVLELLDARTLRSRGIRVLPFSRYSFAGHGMLAQIADTDDGRELRLFRVIAR